MPHIVIEHSEKLDIDDLMQELQKLVCEFGLFNPSAVKSRAIAFREYILADGYVDFVHVTISILEGRELPALERLADKSFVKMQQHLTDKVKISLDIREMSAATYRKN
jgi:5-carboxymethyl-2-hydroxymuconate isomerase